MAYLIAGKLKFDTQTPLLTHVKQRRAEKCDNLSKRGVNVSAITSPYEEAHLFVAAVRVLTHRKAAPPSVEEVCGELSLSREWGHSTCRRLKEAGIVETVEDPFSIKLFVADHVRIEELPREVKDSGLNQELENFRKSKEDMTKKVETIQAELARKRQDLFADLNKKMKKTE